jgi:fructose-1,6-bisphosphatase/inositol monophosphatase family enzyme
MTIDDLGVKTIARTIMSIVDREALPRFGRLGPGDITEKHPGDLVTTADHAIENELAITLTGFIGGSVVVGEEHVAANPDMLTALAGNRPVWLIDPIDGTANFVRGRPRFSTLVALQLGEDTIAAWLYAPVAHLMMTALTGAGTWLNGVPTKVAAAGARPERAEVIVTDQAYQTPQDRSDIAQLRRAGITTECCDGVGLTYIDLACGRRHTAMFGWENPWDHTAGLLAHTEAGGVHFTAKGTPFRPAGDNALPIIIASDRNTADSLRQHLLTSYLRNPRHTKT